MPVALVADLAVVAGNVGLGGHPVSHVHGVDLAAGLHHLSGKLVADDHRRVHPGLGPGVPVADVDVRAADRGGFYPDQDVPGTNLGNGQGAQFDIAGGGSGLYHCPHGSGHGSQLLFCKVSACNVPEKAATDKGISRQTCQQVWKSWRQVNRAAALFRCPVDVMTRIARSFSPACRNGAPAGPAVAGRLRPPRHGPGPSAGGCTPADSPRRSGR